MKASSERAAQAAQLTSPIIAAEALRGAMPFALRELSATTPTTISATPSAAPRQPRPLRARDLDNDIGRAAYALGRRRGWEEGLRNGREQGLHEGAQGYEAGLSRNAAQAAQQLQQLVAGVQAELARLEDDLSGRVLDLAIDIARQVLRREVALDPQALLPATGEALRLVGDAASSLELRVHPDDAQALRAHLELQPGLPAWQLREDRGVQRGGCRVESDIGAVDATLQARWEAAMAAIGRPGAVPP